MNPIKLLSLRGFACAAALLVLGNLSSCGILPKKEVVQIIVPQVKVAADPSWPSVRWQLSIARPDADRLTDSSRLVVSPTPGTLQVYAGAAWADRAPDLLQSVLVAGFEDSGKIVAVARQANSVHADYTLLLDIREFVAVYANPAAAPEATVELSARLIENSSARVVAARIFRQVEPASGTAVPAVAQAFDGALNKLLPEMIGWTLNSGADAFHGAAAPVEKRKPRK
ncbi:MAG: ABC-type transport auxiliary lipoprotein family protein [Lysobacteraceae bacterium]